MDSQSSTQRQPCLTCLLASSWQQSFEKQGFHTGTPAASFNLPSALGSSGPINPATAAAYPPAPFMHILTPHQQPHSQILHHHLQQDGQVSTPLPPGYLLGLLLPGPLPLALHSGHMQTRGDTHMLSLMPAHTCPA